VRGDTASAGAASATPLFFFIMEFILLFATGLIISAFGTVVGFGGGVFMVPILTLVFQIPIHLAIGCVIVALFPSALLSTVHNARRGLIDFKVGIMLEVPTIVGTVIGAKLTSYLPTQHLELLFSVMIFFVGLMMLKKKTDSASSQFILFKKMNDLPPRFVRQTPHGTYRMSGLTIALFGLTSGIIAGLFGIGGGFLKGPLMVLGFGMPARVAAPTALFMIVITSAVGSVSHYLLGHIQWEIGLLLVLSFTLGALVGNRRARVTSETSLVKFIGFGLIAAGLSMAASVVARLV
jgi:uncharacterized protein